MTKGCEVPKGTLANTVCEVLLLKKAWPFFAVPKVLRSPAEGHC